MNKPQEFVLAEIEKEIDKMYFQLRLKQKLKENF